jgi:Mrp family chromosome partitioning ATPase
MNMSRHHDASKVNHHCPSRSNNKGYSTSFFNNDYFNSSSRYKLSSDDGPFELGFKKDSLITTTILPHNFLLTKTTTTTKATLFGQHQRRRMCTTRRYHSIAGASPRQMADLEERVWSAVGSNVKYPDTDLYLKKLGWNQRRLGVSKKGTNETSSSEEESSTSSKDVVQILLQVPTLLLEHLEQVKSMVRKEAKREIVQWASDNKLQITTTTGTSNDQDDISLLDVNVNVIPQQPTPWIVQTGQQSQEDVTSKLGPGLSNVSHFLAVYSCKGGVGKSTVACNLAYELARLGGRVGLLDLDIYGPSLPVLVQPDDVAVRTSSLGSNMVCPIEHKGVKLLSLGFVSPNSGIPGSGKDSDAAILRGPMAGKVVTQLLKGTDWGDLDVLILDLPPGTGDVQLTVCQETNLSFAVGVTTPSKLAIADARKGISMFNNMGIETVAMVENMSYFECETGRKHYPFGRGFTGDESVTNKILGINALKSENICQLPISETANNCNDTGVPICLSRPENAKKELEAFQKLAKIVSRELFPPTFRAASSEGMVIVEDEKFDLSKIHLSEVKGSLLIRFFSETGALQKRIPSQNLYALDPKTGVAIDDKSSTSITIEKKQVRKNNDDESMVSIYKAASSSPCNTDRDRVKLVPDRIEEKGLVGFEITWSSGERFIYKRSVIAIAAGGILEK